jgi:2-polyprenyl-6-methoxyphenol hydroxylase-like FAD-dependent oxidoreductase
VVDKATFPSDRVSTHYIHQPGVERLKRWGLLDRLRASNCPPILGINFDAGTFALRASRPPYEDVSEGYCPRRTVLDKILVDAAADAGAEEGTGNQGRV